MKTIKIIIAMITLALLNSNSVFAATTTNTEKTTATLVSSCQFSAPDVAFGDYDANATDYTYATQNFTILCTKGSAWSIKTSCNTSYNTYSTITNTANSSYTMKYQVYTADGQWSDDTNESAHRFTGTGTGQSQISSMTYRMAPNQYVAPGNYTGAKSAEISF